SHYRQADVYIKDNDLNKASAEADKAVNVYRENKRKQILADAVFPNSYLLKTEILILQGNKAGAKAVLEELINEFGMSPAAERARARLEEL
ncbi:MAG: hypothetical protein L0Y76_12400, partial [Ignavibacteria bacterium]|nr:hypothetical protein [Ignavibacteria bacterium]